MRTPTIFYSDNMRSHAYDLVGEVEVVLKVVLLLGVQH